MLFALELDIDRMLLLRPISYGMLKNPDSLVLEGRSCNIGISVSLSPYSSWSSAILVVDPGASWVVGEYVGCGYASKLLSRTLSSCEIVEAMLGIWRVWDTNPLLRLASDHWREFRSVPPSETEATVESCELH